MAWSYNPAHLKDTLLYQIRFKIGDTDEDIPIFEDEELEYLIDSYGPNHNAILYQVASAAIGRLSNEPTFTLGPYSEKNEYRITSLTTLLETVKSKLRSSESILMNPPTTSDIFYYGLMENK